MPVIASAKKKLRGDRKKALTNKKYPLSYKKALKQRQKAKGSKKDYLKEVYSAIDKTLKKKLIHKRKANRLKSKAARLIKASSQIKKKVSRRKTQ